jgi:hypothetical protein
LKTKIGEESCCFVWKKYIHVEEKNKEKNKVRTSWCRTDVHEKIEDD